MHIIVCIKSVVTAAPRGKIVRTADQCAFNPFDRPALEIALQLKETHGGSVTVISMGPPTAAAALREAMAMGADRAALLCDAALAGSDTLATATALAATVTHLSPYDLLLFGTRTADSDTGQVGPQTSVLLGIPMVTGTTHVDLASGAITVSRQIDGFQETYALTAPAALTVHPTAALPRDAALGGLAAAFDDMPVEMLGIEQVGLDPKQVGDAGSPTRVLSMKPVKKQRACQWIEGTPVEQADALVRRLVETGLIG
ncbi:electron transfer flavoprotein subunit beta [Desulfosarcina ovata subsp. sediminis]|uniref:Electron transfer flavoprotein subunit beta n=1 Tax=Desulfosarcina ovata subsp. sediminis TaxID=885957 RepID=A0A5K7ZK65_9BACT|nr:electron transfer flavoprotein subunit beta/FixA family protein [Desulfosarcina ovata]BBO80635.1 electron transfer flavoprotein subunit beta [Desulfosarcina ovata subsp. sediminis]